MRVCIVNGKNFAENFSASVEDAKYAADCLIEIMERLAALKGRCAGMSVWIGNTKYMVRREDDTFYFVESKQQE